MLGLGRAAAVAVPCRDGRMDPQALAEAVSVADEAYFVEPQAQLADAEKLCEEAGRKRSEFEVSIFAGPTKREQLDHLEEIGVEAVVVTRSPHKFDCPRFFSDPSSWVVVDCVFSSDVGALTDYAADVAPSAI